MSGLASNPLLACYQEHYAGLLRFLTKRTRCPDAAQDLMQETWLQLAEQDGSAFILGHEDGLRAYVYTVAANLEIDERRHASRSRERFVTVDDPASLDALATVPDIGHTHLTREALEHIGAALDRLPRRTRDIFLASRLDGAARADIAERYGVSLKTVEREITTAATRLENALYARRGETPPAATGRARRKNLSRLLGLAGALLALPAAWQGWRHLVPHWRGAWSTASARFDGQALPDGSSVLLDSATAIEFAYYATRRVATLRQGAAFFQVVRDAGRPFTVHALDVRITVLGTRFGVDVEAGQVRVDVESGRVRVQAGDGSARELGAGESLSVRERGGFTADVSHGQPGHAAPWREGWLNFDDVPLEQAVQRLSRYTPHAIHVEPGIAGLRVYGRVSIADSKAWLRQLPSILPVRLVQESDGGLRIVRRA
ncbi:sigma-70 family RNA polymerase sigma factor [Thauera linaloolentis]|uniref:sigma-70 family RNA polymerase sigma factor n=1 Tax=Thauera linaloolentis TaxID=76112 RepID=UPI00048A6E70|nr:sigma-70 family RNA polymerase sigma factor [Thauera linaloolentis]MCM8564062.1 sigma-70 family RNA polymerase sigma factor [Thauera linaloolentis]